MKLKEYVELAQRVLLLTREVNQVDVLIEIAMFTPDESYKSIRANAAGTKVIWTTSDGDDETAWANSWTSDEQRPTTVHMLLKRAIAEIEKQWDG